MTKDHTIHTDALSEVSDADLVREAQTTGSRGAVAALYRRYVGRVYHYFYVRTGDAQQAEDLTSRTCVALLESLSRYRERGTFAAWLFTIAARRYADHCRERASASLDDSDDPPDPAPLPETAVVRSEQGADLAAAVRALTPNRAQAVTLHFLGGLSVRETARVMERSKIAVKSLIHHALRNLREILDDEQG